MDIKPIRTEQDYTAAINKIEVLWGDQKDSTEGDELDLLITLVESYELKNYPIAPPDPIDAIKFRMEQMGLTRTDLVKYLGSQSRVSEILNKKRKLTLEMIRKLHISLHIPTEVLVQEY